MIEQKKCPKCGYEFQPQSDHFVIEIAAEGKVMVSLYCPNDKCNYEIEFGFVHLWHPAHK
ncbi:MAG: hypothetical protein PHT07_21540 [Paludibacter sp.]|nr:hypothetical protein [Paludibacter sp.]